jgi:DNA-binding NtrC family response regulator
LGNHILIVDDTPTVKRFFSDALSDNYTLTAVSNSSEALEALASGSHEAMIVNLGIPDMQAEEFTGRIKELRPDLPIVAVTARGAAENATRLMQCGVFAFIEEPFAAKGLRHMVDRAFEYARLKTENRALHMRLADEDQARNLVGNSVQMQHVREKIELAARTTTTVLITGESGVGKDVVAHEIHRMSDRAHKPLVKISCASIPSPLLESELFGCEKGSFSGSITAQRGKFELAGGGTILLDEIGEMDHTIQTRLLRVIQEGELDRVGGSTPINVDVRVLATTSRDLKMEIRKNRFREDLFYRLNVVPLEIPPLRERREDVPLLVDHFIEVFARKNACEPISLTEAAVAKLRGAYWKGNVRQLQNIIERAVILRSGMKLDADYFQFENEREEQLSKVEQAFRFGTIREMEKLMILNRLKDLQSNRTRSAETLDISVRTLRNKLNEYNVPKKHRQRTDEDLSPVTG